MASLIASVPVRLPMPLAPLGLPSETPCFANRSPPDHIRGTAQADPSRPEPHADKRPVRPTIRARTPEEEARPAVLVVAARTPQYIHGYRDIDVFPLERTGIHVAKFVCTD
jgi:hypothetical protein